MRSPRPPARLHEYNGPTSRGARWNSFRPRAGDIILSAPPKCGMTWMQTICAMLIFNNAHIDVEPARLSPWLDSNFEPLVGMLKRLDAQTHRRYLKTHTPLDGLPYYPDVHYVAIFRHPLDAFHSMGWLNLQTTAGSVSGRIGIPEDIGTYIRACINAPFRASAGEQLSVASVAHHLQSFWQYRDLPNIHLVHYADLCRDLPGSIKAIGRMLEMHVTDAVALEMAVTADFASMRANAQQFVPVSQTGWRSPTDFFRKGGNGDWKDVLTEADIAAYRVALIEAIPDPVAAAWLESGGADA